MKNERTSVLSTMSWIYSMFSTLLIPLKEGLGDERRPKDRITSRIPLLSITTSRKHHHAVPNWTCPPCKIHTFLHWKHSAQSCWIRLTILNHVQWKNEKKKSVLISHLTLAPCKSPINLSSTLLHTINDKIKNYYYVLIWLSM